MIHKIIFAAILILSGNQIFSQDSIKGRIIDYETNQTLPGVTIVDGNRERNNFRNGTISDRDGNFKLKLEGSKRNLEIYFVGYYPIKFIYIPKGDNNIDLKEIKLVKNFWIAEPSSENQMEHEKRLRMNLKEYRVNILGKKLKPEFVGPRFASQCLVFDFDKNEE